MEPGFRSVKYFDGQIAERTYHQMEHRPTKQFDERRGFFVE